MSDFLKGSKNVWLYLGTQSIICVFLWSAIEILEANYTASILIMLFLLCLGFIASFKGFMLLKPLSQKITYVVLTQSLSIFNIVIIGLFIGQFIAMAFGLWSFPEQD